MTDTPDKIPFTLTTGDVRLSTGPLYRIVFAEGETLIVREGEVVARHPKVLEHGDEVSLTVSGSTITVRIGGLTADEWKAQHE
jgi:hypothetical protein